jgi:uroporphyrin-III C-methyltransferase
MQPNELIRSGEVWLVGAGPGDPDLLTRKAERLIRAADIVFYDALVGPGVLDLIPEGVERVSVGKRSGRHSKPQERINDLLLAAAQAGKRIVRLKGGDPSVFGRSAEEAAHLAAYGIPVRICPGVTAASAAVAGAGASLTLRGFARRLQFVTAHARAGEEIRLDWQSLADPESTLAIYMGRSVAGEVAAQLMRHGLPGSQPVLIGIDVSLPSERLLRTRLDLLGLTTASLSDDDPVVLIIGQAVAAPVFEPSAGMAREAERCVG